ncbi:MAG: thioredoxin fold domain-containing protein [Planctomycetota bacterium]
MTKSNLLVTVGFFALLAGVIAYKTVNGSVAPTPDVFASQTTSPVGLDDAIEQSRASGRPVLAVATADWCPPCQALKRNALADARVESYIGERTIPIYLDVTNADSPGAADASRLQVSSIPAMYILRDGEVISQHRGNLSADEMLRWLEGAI